ncbi:ATP-dependent DNA helicase [Algoriphagus zhangzhouensis]|uniref:Exodeoxyribonuclease-5 n=1 Tax=Algoriphagus zhangzhouensis TaxID=1073327 RepID=A0A1M7ZCN9_9BACT|nr:AAA family ATPase [Algoriphagus zhangzhouensis]TDY45624.1 exodeoxyribonuclease-5 [Algoriphagus zhangzhouensis]SHO62654.1 exodeoxyribonuclease-5 [Algoriphagus zhangzhouensis]
MGKDNQTKWKPSDLIRSNFSFQPTSGQAEFFRKMDNFLAQNVDEKPTFVLRGYAGTGKTSVISALVQSLPRLQMRSLLLAPTGRAAKVMSNYSGRAAYTIHKIIYKPKEDSSGLGMGFILQKNYYKNTVFIVDESSMLADDGGMSGNLLGDLIRFVFSGEENRLILVGDTAQLPPVGSEYSPALDSNYLQRYFRLHADQVELVEVMRQRLESGILYNASQLRQLIPQENPQIQLNTSSFRDIFKMTGERLEDGLRYAYDKFGTDNTVIVTRSNKNAVQYNLYIRKVIHFFEDEINTGDLLMIVKNNYTYMAESEKVNFLANGDMAEIMKIRSFEELYGFRFATLELRLLDYPDEPHFEAKVLLETLYSSNPSLSREEYRNLYNQVSEDYADIANKTERQDMIRKDPYLNALQVKFAYALTCHKAQGGQWPAVFVDQGYLPDEKVDKDFLRWLYTAVTRASEELYLVNFSPTFFSGNTSES